MLAKAHPGAQLELQIVVGTGYYGVRWIADQRREHHGVGAAPGNGDSASGQHVDDLMEGNLSEYRNCG